MKSYTETAFVKTLSYFAVDFRESCYYNEIRKPTIHIATI